MMKQKRKISEIIVVGAGAAGMTAAIFAARAGADVLVLEHMETAGKKILATGNGKCNYTNSRQGVENYYGDDPAFVLQIMERFSFTDTLSFFEEIGIYPREKDGYYYPASGQASSVREVLLTELGRLDVKIIYNCAIRSIEKQNDLFCLETKSGNFYSKACLMATGGCAAKKTGSDGSGFLYLKKMGHHVIPVVPALVQLQGKGAFFKEIAGIRAEAMIKLYIDDHPILAERGELQLTDFGISGIPVFQLSRFAARALNESKKVYVQIDFSPELAKEELRELLIRRYNREGISANQALVGMYNRKLIPLFLRLADIEETVEAAKVSRKQLSRLVKVIREFHVDITGTKKFDAAQTTAGGVDTTEINNATLESRLVSGLYFAGEMIDIDGRCGGYNLQWAWSSGCVAGRSAAEKIREKI